MGEVEAIIDALLQGTKKLSSTVPLLATLVNLLSDQDARLKRIEAALKEDLRQDWYTGLESLEGAQEVGGKRRKEYLKDAVKHLNAAARVQHEDIGLMPIRARFLAGVCHELLGERPLAVRRFRQTYKATRRYEEPGGEGLDKLLKRYSRHRREEAKHRRDLERRDGLRKAEEKLLRKLMAMPPADLRKLASSWQRKSRLAFGQFMHTFLPSRPLARTRPNLSIGLPLTARPQRPTLRTKPAPSLTAGNRQAGLVLPSTGSKPGTGYHGIQPKDLLSHFSVTAKKSPDIPAAALVTLVQSWKAGSGLSIIPILPKKRTPSRPASSEDYFSLGPGDALQVHSHPLISPPIDPPDPPSLDRYSY